MVCRTAMLIEHVVLSAKDETSLHNGEWSGHGSET